MDDTSAPADTDMPDAPVEASVVDDRQSDEALSPKSHPKQQQPEATAEQTPPKTEDAVNAAEPAGVESADALSKKEDVTMGGTEEPAGSPAAPGLPETKQEETASPAAATTPAVEAESSPKTTTAPASTSTPPPPSAAETSTSEAAQPAAKVSRERDDIDSEDEPVAKRTKVEHADQVQVKTGPIAASDRMEIDRKPGTARPSPQVAGGGRKKLDDASLNDTPITEWQNKQIRAVLAGVKKTKVGGLFRLPVQSLWPQLWADYAAKVTNPTDISTMEKRLRGDGPRYPTMGDFKRDLDLMVENAVSFNGEGHDVTLQAKACREAILSRMAMQYASEPPKPEKKESAKAHPTRHAEPRAPAAAAPTASTPSAPNRPPKPADAAPAPKPAVPESPAFALPPGSNGVPTIRRDSTKPDSRAKRPVKPAHSKDLVYDTKRKKKLPLDLRFCDEVLVELRKTKHFDINAAFMQPVDPVALNIPHYHKVIKRPMDLQTMGNKLAVGDYSNAKEFEKDFDLIVKNCKTFNGEDHVVYAQALRLQDLYRAELSKKDEWMAKHAPVAPAAPHPPAGGDRSGGKDESDSDDAESEADHEQDEERKQVENRVATILKRLEPEQKKLNEMVNSGTADMADVEITQSVVALLQKQLMGERAKLANLPAKKVGGGGSGNKAKPAKSKKSGGGGGGGASVSSKKAAVSGGGGGGGGGGPKRGGTKKAAPKKKISQIEKDIIVESLGNLDGPLLERAIDLIKKDTGQGENDAGELELDIDTVSDEALGKLYEIAIKANPNARAEKERQYGAHTAAAPQVADPPASNKSRGPSSKSKKNKPMSKVEQERRIQQLNELRAQAARQGSGSQEPIESIEGPGGTGAEAVAHESEDEVDSEED